MQSLFEFLNTPAYGLRIAKLSIRPEQEQHCTLCEGLLPSAADGWAPVQVLYTGNDQLGIACADCVLALRKTEHMR